MGADLTIKTKDYPEYMRLLHEYMRLLHELNESKWEQSNAFEKEHGFNGENYFRDSYNNSNLLWVLGLSWWEDIKRFLTREGDILPDKAANLLELVRSRSITIPADDDAYGLGREANKLGREYFEQKKQRFEAFLQRAIDLKLPIHAST